MKIREKIFLGVGTYVFLAALIGFYAFGELYSITAKLPILDTLDSISRKILDIRRHEKNFLHYGDNNDRLELKRLVGSLRSDIGKLRDGPVDAQARSMESLVGKYEHLFDSLSGKIEKEHSGLREYRSLSDLYKARRVSEDALRATARELEKIPDSLYRAERAEVPSLVRRSMYLLLMAMLTIIILGAYVNTRLAMGIAHPIRKLEEKARRIALGDFTEQLDIRGTDEVASLARAFSRMEEQLQHALGSLEHTIERLKEQQAKLIEAEKMASVGILTAGIAHEINNPLTSVLSFSKLILEQTPETDPNHARLRIMVQDAHRARTIVRDLLSFAKETPMRMTRININQPVIEIIESLIAQDEFKEVDLTLDFAEELPDIEADPVRIGQVVLNLVLNAIHSITPPGRIEVGTRDAGSVVEIVVTDTGQGIPEKDFSRIFDPFFTTKGPRKGTGLGLAISYGIIKAHGGEILVRSTPGAGTSFTVRLPSDG